MFDKLDMSNLNDMMGDFQKKAEELKNENENKVFTAKSGGGMVSVSINGNGDVIDLNIDDEMMDDKDSLQILLISAINDAIKMSEDNKKNATMSMLGGMNIFGNQQ
jgi:DNA-binding YbaB/EbfC family protein